MSTILKRFFSLALLVLLCSFKRGVFGVAESGNSLLGTDTAEMDGDEMFLSRKRKSARYEEEPSSKSSGRAQDETHSDKRASNALNYTSEKTTESPAGVEAQVKPNTSLPMSAESSFSLSVSPSPSEKRATSSLLHGPSHASEHHSIWSATPVSIRPSESPSVKAKLVPQSVTVTSDKLRRATSSVVLFPMPSSSLAPSRTISVAVGQSSRVSAPTQRVPTTSSGETTTGVNVRANSTDKPEKNTLFGFVTLEILIALLAGAACAVLLVAFLVYRLRKRNEGSYELCEMVNYNDTYSGKDSEKEVFV